MKLAFTTAFHTRFPEVWKAALNILLWLGCAIFRHFYKRSAGVLVPTPSVLRMLEGRGFRNLRGWNHGVDMDLFAYREEPQACAHLGRVAYEKNIGPFFSWAHASPLFVGYLVPALSERTFQAALPMPLSVTAPTDAKTGKNGLNLVATRRGG